jgi:hypothetical protein
LAITAGARYDLVLGASYIRSASHSEFRDWVDNDDRPITQQTLFERAPLTAGIRYYLNDRGRSVGQFAWIPARYAVYAGGGAGFVWYRFHQRGDYVDFETLDVYPATYDASDVTPIVHLALGGDYSISKWVALNTEARYSWAHGNLSADWVGFEPIDLSGLSITAGVHIRF